MTFCPVCQTEYYFDGMDVRCNCPTGWGEEEDFFSDPDPGSFWSSDVHFLGDSLDEPMEIDQYSYPPRISPTNHFAPPNRYSPPRNYSPRFSPPGSPFSHSTSAPRRNSPIVKNSPTKPPHAEERHNSLLDEHWTDNSPIRRDNEISEEFRRQPGFHQQFPTQSEGDDYLSQGLREIENALSLHFRGRQFPKHVSIRAKDLFRKSFEIQLQQKAGDVAFKKHRRSSNHTSHRVRYGRRKAFVITAIIVALKEFGVALQGRMRTGDKETIALLSDSVPGNNTVSVGSVKSCCRDLCLDDIRFR